MMYPVSQISEVSRMSQTALLTVEQVAARLMVTPRTVPNMTRRGSLPGSYRLDPNIDHSPYRVPVVAVELIEAQRSGRLQDESTLGA